MKSTMGIMVAEEGRSEVENEIRIATTRKPNCSNINLEIRNSLVMCSVWSDLVYGCKTWKRERGERG